MAKAKGQTVRVNLCKPLPHQAGPHRHPARYHLRNWGRRTGKDTLGFTEINVGRGPADCPHPPGHCQRHLTQGRSCWAGLRDQLDVVWLAPAHPQADLLWLEQIVPRCSNPAYEIHTQDKRVQLIGGGSLWVKSAADHDTINSIRGMGKQLGGVIINEAAHLDLEYALTNVIAAATMDRGAWVTIQSTPKRGSYFNQLCADTKDGGRDPATWHYSRLTFRDNISLPANAEQSLAELITPGTDAWREEVEAELLIGGGGLVVPMWDARVHAKAPDPPASWPRAAGLDWGMRDPTVLVCGAQGPEDTIIWYEATFKDMTAYKVGFTIGRRLMKLPWIEYIAGDTQMWDRQATGPTIAERFQAGLSDAMGAKAVQLVPANKGPGSVQAGVNLLQELMTWSGDPEALHPWQRPRLTIHPRCETLCSTLGRLVLDEPKPGKPVTIKPGQNDHCLAPDTPVLTDRGWIPIASVSTAMRVLTRDGWCRVLSARQTQPMADVYEVTMDDGRSVISTANHPFHVEGVGFVRCDALRYGDPITSLPWSDRPSFEQPARYGATPDSGYVDDTSVVPSVAEGANTFTDGYTGTWSERFPTATTSIIGTMTPRTMSRPIWSSWRHGSTNPTTAKSSARHDWPPFGATSCTRPPFPGPCPPSSDGMPRVGDGRRPVVADRLMPSVRSAANHTALGCRPAPSSVATTVAKLRSVVAVGQQPVWNLHVDGRPEFFAAGLLVHNSFDALRYYLASRPPKEEIETVEAVDPDVHPGFEVDLKRRRVRHRNPVEERAADRERWRRDIGGYSFDMGNESDLVEFDGDL